VIIIGKQVRKESEKKRTRDIDIKFRVTEKERDMIDRRMAQSGVKNRRAYLLRMAMDGQIVRLELDSVKEMVQLCVQLVNSSGFLNGFIVSCEA